MAVGATMLPFDGISQSVMAALEPEYYPPSRMGLRGSHPGSNDHAHSRAWSQKTNWGSTTDLDEVYDLVVVGGGISGLAAAFLFQQEYGKDKKVLILDNHDDFGGHAKRNEHTINGETVLGEGGSESMEYPAGYSKVATKLIEDLGVELYKFKKFYDAYFFIRNGL